MGTKGAAPFNLPPADRTKGWKQGPPRTADISILQATGTFQLGCNIGCKSPIEMSRSSPIDVSLGTSVIEVRGAAFDDGDPRYRPTPSKARGQRCVRPNNAKAIGQCFSLATCPAARSALRQTTRSRVASVDPNGSETANEGRLQRNRHSAYGSLTKFTASRRSFPVW